MDDRRRKAPARRREGCGGELGRIYRHKSPSAGTSVAAPSGQAHFSIAQAARMAAVELNSIRNPPNGEAT